MQFEGPDYALKSIALSKKTMLHQEVKEQKKIDFPFM
jgi:hypothetical protein